MIVLAVIIATLLDQPTATVVDAPKAVTSLPKFTFFPQIFSFFHIGANNGFLTGYNTIQNTTAWRPNFDGTSATISQDITFRDLNAVYYNANAQLGFIQSNGELAAGLVDNTFHITLNATSVNGTCYLAVQLESQALNVSLDLSALGALGKFIQGLPAFVGVITSFLSGFLTPIILPLLESLIGQNLPNVVDYDSLCEAILNGTMTDYPQPEWNSFTK